MESALAEIQRRTGRRGRPVALRSRCHRVRGRHHHHRHGGVRPDRQGHPARIGRGGPGAAADIGAVGAEVEFGGPAAEIESGPSGSEIVGLIAAMIVLLLAFGSLYAMVVPILTALFALAFGLSVVGLLSAWIPIGTSAPVVAAMIGLGVGIDYALLIVTRHREGMFTGHEPAESISIAVATAGRSVLVAGSTVIVALLSLFLIGIPFVSALGLASAITVAATLLAAITLLPALLAVFGGKLDRLRIRRLRFDHGGGHVSGWHRWTRRIQRRPWPYLRRLDVVLLILAAAAAVDPTRHQRRQLRPGGQHRPQVLRHRGDGVRTRLDRSAAGHRGLRRRRLPEAGAAWLDELRADLAATPGVAAVPARHSTPGGDAAIVNVVPSGHRRTPSTEDLVHQLRDRRAAAGRGCRPCRAAQRQPRSTWPIGWRNA